MDSKQVADFWEGNAETWTKQVRQGLDEYRDLLNTPHFIKVLPDIKGKLGLDIGCGEGANTRKLAQMGANMLGIDVAPTFVRYANEHEKLHPQGIRYITQDASKLDFEDSYFDFATAFMSLMDMADQGLAIKEAARVIKPSGFFQFSILHPCFVPPYRKTHRNPDGTTRAIEVADYFKNIDGFVDKWWFSTLPVEQRERTKQFQIPRFHRTLSQWVAMINDAGLIIQYMGEPCATDAEAKAHPILEDTQMVPIFLHVRAIKPKSISL